MKNVAKFAYGLVAACVLAVGGVGSAQDSATGTVQIVNKMASTIRMNAETSVTIEIDKLNEAAESDGFHAFTYTNHTSGDTQITARLEADLTDGLTLEALTKVVKGDNGTVEPDVQLRSSARVIISGIEPAAGSGEAQVSFKATASQPFTNNTLTVVYTIGPVD